MTKEKVAQTILKDAGHYSGSIDGDFGKNSRKAAHSYYDFPDNWNSERLVTGVIQVTCVREGISIGVGGVDGWWGQGTQGGYEKLLKKMGIEDPTANIDMNVDVGYRANNWPRQNYSSMVNYYGKVGTNQTSFTMPFDLVIAWDTNVTIKKVTCHKKCKDAFERIWVNTLKHYGLATLQELRLHYFGGCLSVRKMRGGSSWSTHSWGCAWDIDPDRNRLRWGRDKAYLARPEYEPFWKIVEAEGATSLLRARNFDAMHFQFCDL